MKFRRGTGAGASKDVSPALAYLHTLGLDTRPKGRPLLEFEPGKILNVWPYPGLKEGAPPDRDQVELVADYYLTWAGVPVVDHETHRAMCAAVREVYSRASGRPGASAAATATAGREPTTRDLLRVLKRPPFETSSLSERAKELGRQLELVFPTMTDRSGRRV